jgi:hypothetical protein
MVSNNVNFLFSYSPLRENIPAGRNVGKRTSVGTED